MSSNYIADPADLPPYPEAVPAPHAALWRRGRRRRFEAVPGRHAELVVLMGISGQARYLLDGSILSLGRGSLLWALGGQSHMLLSESLGFDMWVVLAHPKLWDEESAPRPPMTTGDAASPGLRLLSADSLAELETLAEGVMTTEDTAARGMGLRWWLLRAWAAMAASEQRGAERGLHPAVARAAHLMRAAPEVAIPDVAARSGLSESRLRRVFAAEMGQSPHSFRREQRLARADLLIGDGSSLTSAALEAGFGSYAQFFRDFRAARGMSPREWYAQRGDAQGPASRA